MTRKLIAPRYHVWLQGLCIGFMFVALQGCSERNTSVASAPQPATVPAPAKGATAPAPVTDIVTWFNEYYRYAAADIGNNPDRYLPVMHNAFAAKASAEAVFKDAEVARIEALDHKTGYLAIGGANDDSELTMAAYKSKNGGEILVVDSTICVDDCDIHVDVFGHDSAGKLVLLPTAQVFPALNAIDFVTPGEAMPKQFAGITPSLRYRPVPNGRYVEVSTWFGARAQEDHERWAPDDMGVMGTVTLLWDSALGKFVRL